MKKQSNLKKVLRYKKRKTATHDTDSDSDLSINMMDHVPRFVKRAKTLNINNKKVSKNDKSDTSDEATVSSVGGSSTAEERAFMSAINHKEL